MGDMSSKEKVWTKVLFVVAHVGLIAFLLLFFAKWTPLVLYNSDDWWYMGTIRVPLPKWGAWEPARIFPEVAMPIFSGRFAAWIIYPITGDYVFSVTLASAITMTVMIVIMCVLVNQFLMHRLNCSVVKALLLEGMFIVSCFLIFRNKSGSKSLFYSADLCTAYFYTMSGILNAILMLILFKHEDAAKWFKELGLVRKVLLYVLIYFAMFSNLFHSAITVMFVSAVIFIDMVKEKSIFRVIRKQWMFVSIIMIWFVVMVFEYFGGRADAVNQGFMIGLSISQLKTMIMAISIPYKIIALATIIGLVCLFIFGQKSEILSILLLGEGLLIVFLLLLAAKVPYMSRIEASWGIWYYLILISVVCCSYLIKDSQKLQCAGLVALVVMIFLSWYPDGKYAISSTRNPDYALCYKASTYMFDSIVDADKAGETQLELRLPKTGKDDEFTFVPTVGGVISDALYMQGIIGHKIYVTEVFDEGLNAEFLGSEG